VLRESAKYTIKARSRQPGAPGKSITARFAATDRTQPRWLPPNPRKLGGWCGPAGCYSTSPGASSGKPPRRRLPLCVTRGKEDRAVMRGILATVVAGPALVKKKARRWLSFSCTLGFERRALSLLWGRRACVFTLRGVVLPPARKWLKWRRGGGECRRHTGRDEQLTRLQAQVDDLEALLAHHDEHGWREPDEEAHVLRRLREVRCQLARLRGSGTLWMPSCWSGCGRYNGNEATTIPDRQRRTPCELVLATAGEAGYAGHSGQQGDQVPSASRGSHAPRARTYPVRSRFPALARDRPDHPARAATAQ
jgi:hypothetical protein